MINALLVSTSTLHGEAYLEYMKLAIKEHFQNSEQVVFIPYARPGGISHDEYTSRAKKVFSEIGLNLKGIHEFSSIETAMNAADGFFTGGGNTFLLVSELYRNKVMEPLQEKARSGIPYMGTSAGSNIGGLTMNTTNDMPIIYPPTFKTLGLIPFNINPHYLDPDPHSKHKGETRETRIKEFHVFNSQPVVGLREGSWVEVKDGKILLKGILNARIFEKDQEPYEIEPGTELSHLN